MLFGERLPVLLSEVHDCTHIDLIKCSQHSICILGLLQSACNSLPHPTHGDSNFRPRTTDWSWSFRLLLLWWGRLLRRLNLLGWLLFRRFLFWGFLLWSFLLGLFFLWFCFFIFLDWFGCLTSLGISIYFKEVSINFYWISFLSKVLLNDSCVGCSDFHIDLICLYYCHYLIFLHEISCFLHKLLDSSFCDGISHFGYFH